MESPTIEYKLHEAGPYLLSLNSQQLKQFLAENDNLI